MTTTTLTAAAPADAAPAAPDAATVRPAALLRIERDMRYSLGAQVHEDVPADRLTLSEGGGNLLGLRGPYIWSTRTEVVVTEKIGGEPLLKLSAAQARSAVLAMREADPIAAHARDLEHLQKTADHWRSCYEDACRKLASRGPDKRWDHPEGQPVYGIANDSYGPMCPLHDRQLYSGLLARWVTALDALRRRGPHVPEQGCLF